MQRRFFRKANDKVFGGVCSGLADYFGMDVSIVRLLTFAAIMATGVMPGLLLYILCIIIVPYGPRTWQEPHFDSQGYSRPYHEDSPYEDENEYRKPGDGGNSRIVFGALLIATGAFLLARLIFPELDWRYIIAGLLVFSGLYVLLGSKKE